MPPVIGVTTGIDDKGFFSLRSEYVRAVEKAGGVAVLLAPGTLIEAVLERLDGVLLSGGSDIDPAIYGEPAHPTSQWKRERDDFELSLTRTVLDHDVPLLAICRGQQVLNVAAGGTLVQDIPSQQPQAGAHYPKGVDRAHIAHDVAVLPGTRLREIVGRDRLAVNSFHHQSVKDLGRGLLLSARADDGIVEAIESPAHRFVVGVQWHPEAMWNRDPDHQELFRSFVGAAGSRR